MQKWSNLLLVAGTNRNVGKTTFICKLIAIAAKKQPITAIKITPHFHELTPNLKMLYNSPHLVICKELAYNIHKDSSRMLAAGAKDVFYIQTTDEKLPKAIEIIEPLLTENEPVICESAALHKHIEPGLFIVMSHLNDKSSTKNKQLIQKANLHIINFNYQLSNFIFNNANWKINK